MSTKPITELDFDNIKKDIIEFIKSDPTFSDYNFEGSALNSIIDILAFNTHTNAYYANMLHNEGFIDTAQKRGSVVSKAKELGYSPSSAFGSKAIVNATSAITGLNYIPRGSLFYSTNDIDSYTFVCVNNHFPNIKDGLNSFDNLVLVQGNYVSNSYKVNANMNIKTMIKLPNKNIDLSTLKVFVKDSSTSTTSTEYTLNSDVFNNTAIDTVYFSQESYDGYYQLYFGENVLGKQPIDGSIVEISYVISTAFSNANGCSSFTSALGCNLSTVQISYGGTDKESIDSIRYRAPQTNMSKHRAVTSNDYSAILYKKFPYIKTLNIWGGEYNTPPVYGKVFISIQPIDGFVLTDYIKNYEILPLLKNYSVISITPEFVEPEYTYVSFITKLKCNQNKLVNLVSTIENLVKEDITSYVKSISTFKGDLLHSNVINRILDIDPGISSVSVFKRLGFKVNPSIFVEKTFTKNLYNALVPGSILSSEFNYYDNDIIRVSIKEITSTYTTNSIGDSLVNLGLFDTNNRLIAAAGVVNLTTGVFTFTVNVYSYITNSLFIYISCETVEDDITVKNNQILTIDAYMSDSSIGIPAANQIATVMYAK